MTRWLPLGSFLVLVMVCTGGCSSESDVKQMNWQSLYGDAVDGSLLAEQIVAGRTSVVFARAHAQELQDDVNQVEINTSDDKLPGYQDMQQLADQLGNALGQIVVQPDDRSVALQAQTALKDLSDKIRKASS